MAAEVAVGALNIVSGVFGAIGLASFAASFVEKPLPAVSHVTIAVGQSASSTKDDPDTFGGNIPAVSIYAIDGRLVGSNEGNRKKMWPSGSKNQVVINNDKGVENVQSEYVAIYATGTNALCISAVGLKNSNDDFHWSDTIVGDTANTVSYRPNCVWISGIDSKNGIITQGFSTHIIDFSQVTQARTDQYNASRPLMCNSPPRFSAWTSIISEISPPFFLPGLKYNDDGTDVDPQKVFVPGVDKTDYKGVQVGKDGNVIRPIRLPPPDETPTAKKRNDALIKRSKGSANTLISSPYPGHSAKELCDSPNSYGPDVVSENEGLFCDMEAKVLWPLCVTSSQKGCLVHRKDV